MYWDVIHMTATNQNETWTVELKKEIMLQVNQRLLDTGVISEELYRQAKVKIVNGT